MNITTNLDGEQVTIINVTGDVKNQAVTYIDSTGELKVKVLPLDWSRKLSFATDAIESSTETASYQLLSGVGSRVWLHGSSTTEMCSMTNLLVTQTSAEFDEYNRGYWAAIQSTYNNPFEFAFNTGVGGSVLSAQTLTLSNIISSTSANYFDICFLQYMANDITNAIQVSSFTPTITSDILKLLQAKKKVVLIVPHPKSGPEVSVPDFNLRAPKYVEYLAFCKGIESKYPDQVFVIDNYSIWNGGRVPVEYSADGTHLDSPGNFYIAPVWKNVINRLKRNISPAFDGYAFGGQVVQSLFGTGGGINVSNVSGVYLEPDEYGRSRFSCSGLTSLGNISRVVTLEAGATYKIFLDFELLENFGGQNQYTAGAKIQGGTENKNRRLLVRNVGIFGLGRHRLLSAPMVVQGGSYNLFYYTGGRSILYGVYLIKVS